MKRTSKDVDTRISHTVPGGGSSQNLNFAISIVDILNELYKQKPFAD